MPILPEAGLSTPPYPNRDRLHPTTAPGERTTELSSRFSWRRTGTDYAVKRCEVLVQLP